MPDFTVRQRGTDTSGRAIFATDYMWSWWLDVCDALGFTPTVVQGAFMTRAGGGATESAGYHDAGGCFDLRTWDRTADEVERMVRVLRLHGAAAWRRDERHGMDPHLHFVLGTDKPLAAGALDQWQDYIEGRNGLASNGPDYEWRPSPLVLTPPEDDMPYSPEQLTKIVRDAVAAELDNYKAAERERYRKVREAIARRFDATDEQLDEILGAVDQ